LSVIIFVFSFECSQRRIDWKRQSKNGTDKSTHFYNSKIEIEIDRQKEILTLQLLNKQYSRLNLNSDKEDDIDGTYALRNSLRENYWARIEQKEELLQFYKNYITYRALYPEIDTQPASILCLLYKSVEEIKSELASFLTKENQEPSRHVLFQEICAFYACIEVLLRFKDPQNPILPKVQSRGVFDLVEDIFPLLLLLESTPIPFRKYCLEQILAREDISRVHKMLLLAWCTRSELEQ